MRATGPAVTGLGIGDRVHTSCPKPVVQHGTYAELVAAQAALVAPVPPGLGLADAAAVPLVALTAWQGLFEFAGLARGQSVLVHAGAGGVGSLAIQLAKGAGATVLTTAGPANHDYVAGLGADHVIDYRSADFVDAVHRILPAGVDVVYDGVGGAV